MAYLPLSTANLPDPAINPAQGSTPDQYFDVGIWTGDGVNGRNIADLYGHTPDWVWIKNRSAAIDHNVADVLRGWKELYPNLTNAEGSQQMNAPTNDGLSGLPASNGYNNNGDAYVSWAWKANGSGVSNTDGTITSTVSANTESGFSIVGYAGNSASNQTIGHGLTSAPQMVVHKNRTNANDWVVDVGNITGTAGNALRWNNTSAITNNVAILPNKPTSSVFYVSTDSGEFNVTGRDYIAYCFHSVEGFSKLGSYTGNGSTDGPFVYTGFRPSMIMVKASSTTSHWYILDTERNTYNEVDSFIKPNSSNADATSLPFDFTSNGFKIRTSSGGPNSSGATYIYMAFAENPFKFSLAR